MRALLALLAGLAATAALSLAVAALVLHAGADRQDCSHEEKVLVLLPAGKVPVPVWVCPR